MTVCRLNDGWPDVSSLGTWRMSALLLLLLVPYVNPLNNCHDSPLTDRPPKNTCSNSGDISCRGIRHQPTKCTTIVGSTRSDTKCLCVTAPNCYAKTVTDLMSLEPWPATVHGVLPFVIVRKGSIGTAQNLQTPCFVPRSKFLATSQITNYICIKTASGDWHRSVLQFDSALLRTANLHLN